MSSIGEIDSSIIFTDIFAYSTLMEHAEIETHLLTVKGLELCRDIAKEFHGRTIQESTGDGHIYLFESGESATACALKMQRVLSQSPLTLTNGERIVFRMAVHGGKILNDGDRYFGNTINQAARLQSIATPGTVLLSDSIYTELCTDLRAQFNPLDTPELTNLGSYFQVYSNDENVAKVAHHDSSESIANGMQNMHLPVLGFFLGNGDHLTENINSFFVQISAGLAKFREFQVVSPGTQSLKSSSRPALLRKLRLEGLTYLIEIVVIDFNQDRITIQYSITCLNTSSFIFSEEKTIDRQTSGNLTSSAVHQLVIRLWSVLRIYHTRTEISANHTLSRYSAYLKAKAQVRSTTPEGIAGGIAALEYLVESEPNFLLAQVELSFAYQLAWRFDLIKHAVGSLDLAIEKASNVIERDPFNADAYRELGYAHIFNRDYGRGIDTLEKAVQINPMDVISQSYLAEGYVFTKRTTQAIALLEKSLEQNGEQDRDFRLWSLADAHYIEKNYQTVVDTVDSMWDSTQGLRLKAASLANLDRLAEAKTVTEKILQDNPDFSVRQWRTKQADSDPAEIDHFCDGLLKAGLPM